MIRKKAKPEQKTKTTKVAVRVPDPVLSGLRGQAQEAGVTLSEIINAKLTDRRAVSIKAIQYADPELLYHLGKIGTNLNQIAYQANKGNLSDVLCLEGLNKVEKALRELSGRLL